MKSVFIFCTFIIYVFVVGALISPWAYELIQLGKDSSYDLLSYLADQKFGKISNRCFMLVAAIGIYPMLKAFDCFNKKDLGYDLPRKEFIKEIGRGLPLGLVSLSALAALIVYFGLRVMAPGAGVGTFIMSFCAMLPGALALAFIEETFFRGIVINSMRRTLKLWPAILISAVLFASVHLLRNKTGGTFTEINWYTGFSYLGITLRNYTDPGMVGPWLTLFACGIFLSFVSLHYGNIGRCIGIHMGWVLIIKAYDDVTNGFTKGWMIGNYDKVTGYLSLIIISSICFIYWLIFMRKKKAETETELSQGI
jgi:membrane protease YdiL (CAAX protease family)